MAYVDISLTEMRDFLKLEKGWVEGVQNNEITFTYPLKKYPFIVIKVFSSVRKDNALSRGYGKDALRVAAVNTNTNSGWIKAAHCKRIDTWKTNLQGRIEDVIYQSKERLGANKI